MIVNRLATYSWTGDIGVGEPKHRYMLKLRTPVLAAALGLAAILAGGTGPAFAQTERGQQVGGQRGGDTTQVSRKGPAVTGVRVGLQANRTTRFVLDISERVAFQAFTLSDPYRVVVDMQPVDWKIGSQFTMPGDSLISTYRTGSVGAGNTRLVLELSQPGLIFQTFVLPPTGPFKYRLVVDIKPATEAEYAAEEARQRAKRIPQTATTTSGTPGAAGETKAKEEVKTGATRKLPKRTTKKKVVRKRLVVIDAGHGGKDPGAIGVSGAKEKTITLYTAKRLKRAFLATGRYKVVMTRERDRIVPLRERIRIARAANADLFISLHADSIHKRAIRGAAVYTLSERASDHEAARLAKRENQSDEVAGIKIKNEDRQVQKILIDLAQRDTMNESAQYATMLIKSFSLSKIETLHRTHRFAGFVVLKAPDVPAVLVELGFLSNARDELLLRNSKHRAKLAAAIVRATDSYFILKDRLAQK